MSVTVRRAGVEDITALASLRWTRRVDEMDEQRWGERCGYATSEGLLELRLDRR